MTYTDLDLSEQRPIIIAATEICSATFPTGRISRIEWHIGGWTSVFGSGHGSSASGWMRTDSSQDGFHRIVIETAG